MGCLSDQSFQIPCQNFNVLGNNNNNQPIKQISISTFQPTNTIKDGLYVYEHSNNSRDEYHKADYIYCPLCYQPIEPNEVQKMSALKVLNGYDPINRYRYLVKSPYDVDIFEELESLAIQIENNQKYMENLLYKYICPQYNYAIYLKLYDRVYRLMWIDKEYYYENWGNNPEIKKRLLKERKVMREKQLQKDEEEKRKKEARERDSGGMMKTIILFVIVILIKGLLVMDIVMVRHCGEKLE